MFIYNFIYIYKYFCLTFVFNHEHPCFFFFFSLTFKSESVSVEKSARWSNLPESVRKQVKDDLVVALAAATPLARAAAAQVVAKVGKIEIPLKMWPELVNGLTQTALTPSVQPGTKAASVTALGYLCEEIVGA
jgi:importin subunit beta-1